MVRHLLQRRNQPNRKHSLPLKREERSSKIKPVNVWYGSGENAELSNLAARPFTFDGRDYLSVEHAYQSNKSGSFDKANYDAYMAKGDASGVEFRVKELVLRMLSILL